VHTSVNGHRAANEDIELQHGIQIEGDRSWVPAGGTSETLNGDAPSEIRTRSRKVGRRSKELKLETGDLKFKFPLGRGSCGLVYAAAWRNRKEIVAVKRVDTQAYWKEYRKDDELKELKTLMRARSNSIVHCYGIIYGGDHISMVLEHMDAGSLADLRNALKQVSPKILGRVARQVVQGLVYTHTELKVVHRDCKPENILLKMNGEVKLSDFGVSGELKHTTDELQTWIGTISYMSPERITNQQYGCKTDVWSLGVCLHECVQGRFPYEGNSSFWDLLDAIVKKAPPDLIGEQVGKPMQDFVSRALRKSPSARASAEALSDHAFVTKTAATQEELSMSIRKASARPCA
jgi:mitogen-activated protein kinase kinase 1